MTNPKEPPPITAPLFSSLCWVQVRRYVGSLNRQYTNCGNRARPGCLTCKVHAAHEERAQKVSALAPVLGKK